MTSQPRTNGHLIRAIRRARRLPQNEVANLAGIHKGYLSRVEHGGGSPLDGVTRRIAAALDVDPAVLTGQLPPFATLRRFEGLSVRDLASRCGITPARLTRIEQGAEQPDPELLAVIATRLGCPVEALTPILGRPGGKVA